MQFKERLKSIRIEKNLTQKQVYTKLGVSPNCYASYEQGRTEPNIETIKQLCYIFQVSSDYLLGLEDDYGQKNYIEESFNNSNINSFNNNSGTIKFKA